MIPRFPRHACELGLGVSSERACPSNDRPPLPISNHTVAKSIGSLPAGLPFDCLLDNGDRLPLAQEDGFSGSGSAGKGPRACATEQNLRKGLAVRFLL